MWIILRLVSPPPVITVQEFCCIFTYFLNMISSLLSETRVFFTKIPNCICNCFGRKRFVLFDVTARLKWQMRCDKGRIIFTCIRCIISNKQVEELFAFSNAISYKNYNFFFFLLFKSRINHFAGLLATQVIIVSCILLLVWSIVEGSWLCCCQLGCHSGWILCCALGVSQCIFCTPYNNYFI